MLLLIHPASHYGARQNAALANPKASFVSLPSLLNAQIPSTLISFEVGYCIAYQSSPHQHALTTGTLLLIMELAAEVLGELVAPEEAEVEIVDGGILQ